MRMSGCALHHMQLYKHLEGQALQALHSGRDSVQESLLNIATATVAVMCGIRLSM
jgi:hypothetical protein